MIIKLQSRLSYLCKYFAATIFLMVFTGLNVHAQLCFSPPVNYNAASSIQFGTIADFNNDGIPDLAVPNSGTMVIMLGNGTGGFGTASSFSVGSNSQDVTSADFNKDGNIDLVVTSYASNNVYVMLGNGDGTFAAPVPYSVGSNPYGVTCADFNGDGFPDMAVVNQGSNNVSILINNGLGVFGAAANFGVGSGPIFITGADFNKDGNIDLAVTNRSDNNVSVLTGDGMGGFSTPTNLTGDSDPFGIISADFNNDGFPDIATTNNSPGTVSVFLNDGAGGFSTGTIYPVDAGPTGLAFADFDGDGNIDLAASNESAGDLSVLLGNGNGGFGSAINFITPHYGKVMAADVNNDGKPDLVTTNWGSGDVSVLLNQPAVAMVSADTTICTGASVQLNAGGGATYEWTASSGTVACDTCHNPVVSPTTTTKFIVTASNGSCSATDSVTVTVKPSLSLQITPADTTICSGSTVALSSTGATSYTWTPAAGLNCSTCANPSANPTITTTYTVTANNGSCFGSDTVVIEVGNLAVGGTITTLRDTICQGTPGNLTLSGNSSNAIQWEASANDTDFTAISAATNPGFKTSPLQLTTWYRVEVGNGSCNAISDTQQLYVPPALISYFSDTQTGNNQLTFNADSSSGNIRSYHWDFGDGQTSVEKNPVHQFTKDTMYYICLTLYDGSNCSYTFCRYSELIDAVATVSPESKWLIYPNPFSDELFISSGNFNDAVQRIEIYDVIGQLIFSENNQTQNNTLKVNLPGLAQGAYFIRIKTSEGIYSQPLIKLQ